LKVALIAALALAAAPGPAQRGSAAPGAPPDHPFAQPLWDDGRAEVSVYGGTTLRYGQLRPTTAHLIVVKEDLLRESLVKSDSGPVPGRTLTAIKYNFIADFPTGTYTYHQMATVMFDRRDLTVLKETMSHTEGCGITFVRIGPQHGAWMHEAHSYWEGEADRAVAVEWPEGPRAFADALPVWLRHLQHHMRRIPKPRVPRRHGGRHGHAVVRRECAACDAEDGDRGGAAARAQEDPAPRLLEAHAERGRAPARVRRSVARSVSPGP